MNKNCNAACYADGDACRCDKTPPSDRAVMQQALNWGAAPVRIEFGNNPNGWREALLPLGRDHTLRLYAEVEVLALVEDALRAALATPAPAHAQGEGWMRAIDEAMVSHHVGVANPSDTYEQAKAKLNTLLAVVQDIGAHFAKEVAPAQGEPPARAVGEIRRDKTGHPHAVLHTAYDENGDGWVEGTKLYTAPQPARAPLTELAALIEEAFYEGFTAVETYNDSLLNSSDEAWAKAAPGLLRKLAEASK